MTAIRIMAHALQDELVNRGHGLVWIDECEEILRAVIDHASEVAERPAERQARSEAVSSS